MLLTIKLLLLFVIVGLSTFIGVLISKKYSSRVDEIQELITALELLESRLNYTYDTLPDAFSFVGKHMRSSVKKIFEISSQKLQMEKSFSASEVFESTIEEEKIFLSLNDNDIEILKGLSVSLGQVDLENQVKNIRLIGRTFLAQLDEAKVEKNRNFRLCRNMGVLTGLAIVIILM